MNRIGPTIALATLLLMGCGGKSGETANTSANASANASNAAAPADVVKGEVRFQPGSWTNEFQFIDYYAPGVPKALAERMRSRHIQVNNSYKTRCMGPEEAANPSANIFTDAVDSGTCTYDHFLMKDGKFEAKLACIRDDGRPGPAMIVDGTYTRTSFDLRTITQTPNFASPGSPAIMTTTRVKARRVGPCAT